MLITNSPYAQYKSSLVVPESNDVIFELIPGCANTHFNPAGRSLCGFSALSFAFVYLKNKKFADISALATRKYLAEKLGKLKNDLLQCENVIMLFNLEELERDLTLEPVSTNE